MPSRGISILGSTGSIGTNTLHVLERFTDRFHIVGLAAGRQIDRMLEQIARFRPEVVSVATAEDAARVRAEFPSMRALHGVDGMVEVATHPDADFVMSATVGAAGLVPTLRAIEEKKTVGLANKETLVMAGELMTRAVAASGSALLPVDSEHNAVHQCLAGRKDKVKRIWLTASGGPFRTSTREEMRSATKNEALKHPTWNMGRKISIDSATMMNKGLEIIEAHWLFGVPAERVRVVVHPQSTIHSMVELEDGSFLAQLGATDMRLPIQYALTYPERVESDLPPLDLESPSEPRIPPAGPGAFPRHRARLSRARGGRDGAGDTQRRERSRGRSVSQRSHRLSLDRGHHRGDALAASRGRGFGSGDGARGRSKGARGGGAARRASRADRDRMTARSGR